MKKTSTCKASAFERLGGLEGIRALVNTFYDIMAELPKAQTIREMHPDNLGPTRENLTLFLCGWLGGPALYKQKHGSVNLTGIHARFEINIPERDTWLRCMQLALDRQQIESELAASLLDRFRVPAGRICSYCQQQSQENIVFLAD